MRRVSRREEMERKIKVTMEGKNRVRRVSKRSEAMENKMGKTRKRYII